MNKKYYIRFLAFVVLFVNLSIIGNALTISNSYPRGGTLTTNVGNTLSLYAGFNKKIGNTISYNYDSSSTRDALFSCKNNVYYFDLVNLFPEKSYVGGYQVTNMDGKQGMYIVV